MIQTTKHYREREHECLIPVISKQAGRRQVYGAIKKVKMHRPAPGGVGHGNDLRHIGPVRFVKFMDLYGTPYRIIYCRQGKDYKLITISKLSKREDD